MICDFWPAVWNGNFYYGFKKRLAQMSWSGERFSVADEGHRATFHAVLRPGAEPPGRSLDRIRAAAALSVLGHRDDGSFVRSRFDWDFREAAVESASLALTVGQHFRELPLGAHSSRNDDAYLLPPIDRTPSFFETTLNEQIDLSLLAKLGPLSLDEMFRFNPGLNRRATPPNGPHRLLGPLSSREAFANAIEQYPSSPIRWVSDPRRCRGIELAICGGPRRRGH